MFKEIVMPSAATGDTTVRQESCQTLDPHLAGPAPINPTTVDPDPLTMTADQLADFVIEGIKKLNRHLPYIFALKKHFREGGRDRNNRLKVPIKGCYTWSEFCLKHLDRSRQAIYDAIHESEIANRELAPEDLSATHPEVEGKTTPHVRQAAARGRNVRKERTPLQEIQKQLSPFCPSTVDGQEHRLIRLLAEIDAMEVAETETELGQIVVGMLRNIGNSLIASADRLESRTKLAEAA